MVRELITVQVGQCGNQIGRKFWQQALGEHAANNPDGVFDECMSTFFRNVDTRFDRDLSIGDGSQPIYNLKARAVLVDMDSGPVSETHRGELGDLFDERQFVTDVSGAGNNWAHGNAIYGPKYADELLEAIRREAERCDSLQSFFLVHSLGGGTGSGLGTYLLSLLEDHYADVYRFSTAVFPSGDDDVITSPYNTVLALRELTAHADCVLPVDNASLVNIVKRMSSGRDARDGSTVRGSKTDDNGGSGFDSMNGLVARLLTDLTASMRFAGDLNVDLNEITTNLVPYPRLHYILSGISPLPEMQMLAGGGPQSGADEAVINGCDSTGFRRGASGRGGAAASVLMNRPRHMAQMFSDGFSRSNQLMDTDPRASTFLACGLLVRGDVVVSDVNANIMRLSQELRMIHWNQEGFKIGLCGVPPLREKQSLLCLSNNSCLKDTFSQLKERFNQLYHRRAMLHHYTQFVEQDAFEEASQSLDDLISDYTELDSSRAKPEENWSGRARLRPAF
ncbi:unnamed protein product [Discosporangium mesarthrocarpum]